jgi:ribosomal protein L6P/L9E
LLKNNFYIKKNYLLDTSSFLVFSENNILLIASRLGILKLKIKNNLVFYVINNIIIIKNNYNFILKKYKNYNNYLYYFINNISNLTNNLTVGYSIKFKVVGLGHKLLYSKNNYLFKLGYSHMIYCFIPLVFSSKKKLKKKLFNKINSIEAITVNNFFFYIKHLRVPDIFSMNGIFDRAFYIEFKKGKKSFLL